MGDHPTWDIRVEFMGSEDDTTIKGAHRVRHEGRWIIVERFDGDYGNDRGLRAWHFSSDNVKEVSQT